MPEEKKESPFLLSPIGRLSFPSVFKATRPKDENGEEDTSKDPMFEATLVIDYKNLEGEEKKLWDQMVKAANDAALARFKVPLGKEYQGKQLTSPFRPTDQKPKYYEPGMVFVKFSTKRKPHVVQRDKSPIDPDSGDLYAGMDCHVTYSPWAYDKRGNRGVKFTLGHLRKVRDNDAFSGGGQSAEEAFADLPEEDRAF